MNDHGTERNAYAMQAMGAVRPLVSQRDDLVLPRHQRTVVQYFTDDAGVTELCLYYGDKDISFDEPDLFPFGETLARHARFSAGDAMAWGRGYEWARIQPLLQQLIDEGVLVHAKDAAQETVPASDTLRPSPLPPATCPVARSWDDCEAITQDLADHPVELGYLELIVPVFRIAHPYLDADQRQVGEANVFPPGLRLDVPTEWRTCNYPGTRYQSHKPMNVTAMRVMRTHWPQMMAALLRVREAYLRRFPELEGAWTIGHVERLSVAVLAVPTYQLTRRTNRVENGNLHPALASLFRVTDGVRMTMHHMLFVPIGEPLRPPHQTVTVDGILDYVERSQSFHSVYGVCAGPRAMVRELIQVLLEGRGNSDYGAVALEPAIQAAFDDLDAAIDYALHGLRAYAAVFSVWPAMTRAYEHIADTVEAWPALATPSINALRERTRALRQLLQGTFQAHEGWRISRDVVFVDMYQQCGRGIAGLRDGLGLSALLAPAWTSVHRRTEIELQNILRRRFGPFDETTEPFVLDLSSCVMDFLLREQAVLRTAASVQADINRLLGREQPKRALSAADLNVYEVIQEFNPDRLLHLIDELEQMLEIQIDLDINRLTIAMRDATA